MPPDDFLKEELLRPGGLRDRLFSHLEDAHLRSKDIAERLGNDPSKVSRIKRGQEPTEADLRVWAEACGVAPEPLLEVLTEARKAARVSRLSDRPSQADRQRKFINLYRVTPLVREFQSAVIPGILQTSDYARQMFVETRDLHAQLDNLPDDVENAVNARMARQEWLGDPKHRYEFLVDEPVLRRLVVPPPVLRDQLDRVIRVLAQDNVRLGVIPDGARMKAVPWLPFAVFVRDDGASEAFIETPSEARFFAGDQAVPYLTLLDRLWVSAVEGAEARALIAAAQLALPAD